MLDTPDNEIPSSSAQLPRSWHWCKGECEILDFLIMIESKKNRKLYHMINQLDFYTRNQVFFPANKIAIISSKDKPYVKNFFEEVN